MRLEQINAFIDQVWKTNELAALNVRKCLQINPDNGFGKQLSRKLFSD
jgi:hypothetical protein